MNTKTFKRDDGEIAGNGRTSLSHPPKRRQNFRLSLAVKSLFLLMLTGGLGSHYAHGQSVPSGFTIAPFATISTAGYIHIATDSADGTIYIANNAGDINGALFKVTIDGVHSQVGSSGHLSPVPAWHPYIHTGITAYNGFVYMFTPNTSSGGGPMAWIKTNGTTGVSSLVQNVGAASSAEQLSTHFGSKLISSHGNSGNLTIYTYDVATSTPGTIGSSTLPGESNAGMRYARTTNKLYFESGGAVYVVNTSTGATTLVGTGMPGTSKWDIDPQGLEAYFISGNNINKMNLTTGVVSSFATSIPGLSSTNDIAFGPNAGGGWALYVASPGQMYKITPFAAPSGCTPPTVAAITGNTTLSTAFTTQLASTTTGGVWASSNANATVGSSTGLVTGVSAGSATISYTVTSGSCSATVTANVTIKTPNAGMNFDGVNDYVNLGSALLTAGSSYSKEAWIYATASGSCNIISSGNNPFWLSGGHLRAVQGSADISDPATFPLNQWMHVAVTYDNPTNTLRLYKNGVQVASSSSGTPLVLETMYIGEFPPGLGNMFNGVIDEARIWSVVRTPAEIQANMNCDVAQQSGLAAYYRFDEGTPSGTNTSQAYAIDYSGNGKCGTFTNMALSGSTSNYVTGAVGSCNAITPATPGAITSALSVCKDGTVTMTNAQPGGTWSASNSNVSINPTSGLLTGLIAGSSVVTYTLNCNIVTAVVTVNANPSVSIGGTTNVCSGSSSTLTATGATSYSWSPAGSLSAPTGASVVATPTTTTTYTAIGATGSCTGTATIVVSVTVMPTVNVTPSSVTICEGESTSLTGTLVGLPSGSKTTSAFPNLPITDHTLTTSSATLSGVPAGANITTLSLRFNATHTYTGDCIINLKAPNGKIYNMFNRHGGGGDNWSNTVFSTSATTPVSAGSAPFTGTWLPTGDMSVGGGGQVSNTITISELYATPNGTWTVYVYDAAGADAGTFQNWTLTLDYGPAPPTWSPTTGLYTNPSLTTAYTGSAATTVYAAPTSTTTYVVTGMNGICTATTSATVSVNPLPSVTGSTAVCVGTTITLTSTPAGGAWGVNNGNASVSSTGEVTGVTNGGVTVRYTLPTGCFKDHVVDVNSNPSITATGDAGICAGVTTPLSASGAGSFSWSPAASLSSATGSNVDATPTASTTYTVIGSSGEGCTDTAMVTVNVSGSFPIGAGADVSICTGQSTVLSATGTAASFTWSPATGLSTTTGAVVTASPSSTTTYTLTGTTGFCTQTRTVTVSVNPTPGAITGAFQWCKNTLNTLSSTTAGGTWSSSNPSIGSINSTSGVVYGAGEGTTMINYTKAGCTVSQEVTVSATPAIGGVSSICAGLTTTLTNGITGGTWLSSADTTATIDLTTGLLTAIEEGVTTITYTAPGGCMATKQFTVGLPPNFTTGPWVCLGQSIQVGHPISGGVWSTSNPARATIDPTSGIVYGVALGNFYITYTLGGGCVRTMEMAVQTFPMDITGSLGVCAGSTTNLSDETPSGTWSSSNTSVATITLSTGTVFALTPGFTDITYKFQACVHTEQVTVNAIPATISGADELCSGSTATYTSATTGGTWSSSNTSRATIGLTSGIATGGTTAGAVTLTYTSGDGCVTTKGIIVNPQPGVLSGTTSLCAGSGTVISNAANAGTWSSSAPSVATVGSTLSLSTALSALAAGTTTVTTTTDQGCSRSIVITVGAGVAAIGGDAIVCPGQTTALTNATTGGSWSSNATGIATVGSATGIVSGIAPGVATISYRTSATCYAVQQVTVNTAPAAIMGGNKVCIGSDLALTHAETGGTWSSSTPTRATIDATTGVVTGISAGVTYITYQINSGCYKVLAMTVNAAPAAISGPSSICQGSIVAYTDATAGGTWSSTNTSVATVPSTPGNVTGVGAGMTTISYIVTATGCYATKDVTVNAQPTAIVGTNKLCIGSSETYTSTPVGGTWTSSLPGRASIDAASGVATGLTAGAATLTYSMASGCYRTMAMTVNPLPLAIGGTAAVCRNATTTLTNGTTGGTWSVAATGTASVTASGVVTGMAAGMVDVTYKLTATGCQVTKQVTVNELPSAIGGASQICVGNTEVYSSTPTGGTWLSGTPAAASIGATSGMATGLAQGVTAITYTAPSTGCRITKTVSVYALPATITGTVNTVCVGNSITLSSTTAGQTWSSTMPVVSITPVSTTIASFTGIEAGTTTISYTNAYGCARTYTLNVNPEVAPITGDMVVCPTRVINLSTTATGGTWSSALPTKATVSTTGAVTGVAAGNVNISYKVSPGCFTYANVTVNATPAAITGPTSVCPGDSVDLNHAIAGGTWYSSNTAFATANDGNGMISGISSGTATISYVINSGCLVTTPITVKALPAAIGGPSSIGIGSPVTFTNTTTGGTWSSSTPSVGSIASSTGIMMGVSAGSTTITYRVTASQCYRTTDVTVIGAPAGRGVADNSVGNTATAIRIYPNPSMGNLTIEAAAAGVFTLYTLDGKELQQYSIEAPSTAISLPHNLAAGVYTCRFTGTDGSSQIVRIVYQP